MYNPTNKQSCPFLKKLRTFRIYKESPLIFGWIDDYQDDLKLSQWPSKRLILGSY